MCERSECTTAPHRNLRSKSVGIGLGINAAYVLVGAAEICSHAKPMVEVAGKCAIEAVRIHAAVKPGVLVAAEDFRFGIVLLRPRSQHKRIEINWTRLSLSVWLSCSCSSVRGYWSGAAVSNGSKNGLRIRNAGDI